MFEAHPAVETTRCATEATQTLAARPDAIGESSVKISSCSVSRSRHGAVGVALVLALAGCGSRSPSAPDGFVAPGTWGGDHVSLAVDSARVAIEFDCAHGALSALVLDGAGQFEIVGALVLEHGGPVREGEEIVQHQARYSGTVRGGRMTLRVSLVDGSLDLGAYQLTFGAPPRLFKCL